MFCEPANRTVRGWPDIAVLSRSGLAHARAQIVGGSMTPSDESGDAHKFTRGLAARCTDRGVRFRHGVAIAALDTAGAGATRKIAGVRVRNERGEVEVIQAAPISCAWAPGARCSRARWDST